MATRRKAKAKGKTRARPAKARARIELRCGDVFVDVPKLDDLDREARDWSFAIAQRAWWNRGETRRAEMAQVARATLAEGLGVAELDLERLRKALEDNGLLEVAFSGRADSPAARQLPWEYVVTAALGPTLSALPPTVLRCIEPDREPAPPRRRRRVLYVQSQPGYLAGKFDFSHEVKLPAILDPKPRDSRDPTLLELRRKVRTSPSPDVIHIAGFDTHHARALRQPALSPANVADGMVLQRNGDAEDVSAADLAEALCSGEAKPELIVFNLYNSAGDLGAEAVRAGAGAALGFQHAVDDVVAELFLAEFYRMLGPRKLPLTAALVAARERLASYGESFHGTGFVLWTRGSRGREWAEVENERISRAAGEGEEKALEPNDVRDLPIEIKPLKRLNYSLMHNQEPLFESFTIRKRHDGMLADVTVETVLQVGGTSFKSEFSTNLVSQVTDLRPRICLPLTWDLDSLPTERVQTTLSARIRWKGQDLKWETFPVDLQTIDVWIDDDVNRQWLPSFVLPRDPAVTRIIGAAERYLVAIADDVRQGFDGYQSVDLEAADPFAGVDAQVQAIWSALVQDFRLRYVNPPGALDLLLSQRLRSPREIVESGRGTCIDLALLLAACLEHIEIYPAIFLLEGHAFVGYWRSEEGYGDFVDQVLIWPDPEDDLDLDHGREPADRRTAFGTHGNLFSRGGRHPWVYGQPFYRCVANAVQRRQQLVPLEATGIPDMLGFWEAVDKGTENLRSVHDFHSLIDVVAARDHRVTPLPFRRAAK